MSFIVSAPGKVILFGEHSAVYGKPAIAAALSLRAYLLVSPSEDSDVIRLNFPDIKLSFSCRRSELPWEKAEQFITRHHGKPEVTEELVPEIVDHLADVLNGLESSLHYTACLSFLYLYLHLCSKECPGKSFCVRSTVPIGAGLGSSASTSVCLATGLGLLGGHLQRPQFSMDDRATPHVPDLEFIDRWSLMGEKTFHGNPSGIDNAVATLGGAVMFQRKSAPTAPSIRTTMRNLPPLRLILTNTKQPRSTANLVSSVAQLNSTYSVISESILDAMGHIATTAHQMMIKPEFDAESKAALKDLININHGLLVSLGVSHPKLEQIKAIADTNGIGATKLTGAGGGGCAITLVDEDVDEKMLKETLRQFEDEGFETYETSLGGKGVGVLFDGEECLFSSERFTTYKNRHEIEDVLHITKVDGWKFW